MKTHEAGTNTSQVAKVTVRGGQLGSDVAGKILERLGVFTILSGFTCWTRYG